MANSMAYPGPTTENLGCIPLVLTERPQWVLWRATERPGDDGVQITKVPINAQTLAHADITDPLIWQPYTYCVAALETALEGWQHDAHQPYHGGGLGFVLTADDPYTGVDLDHCVDPITGEVTREAQAIVQALDSYTEVTPSATGLRIMARGTLPPRHRRKGDVEMYDTARFLTMTGWHHEGTPEMVEARQGAIDQLWCSLWGASVGQQVWVRDSAGEVMNQGQPWTVTAIYEGSDGRPHARFAEQAEPWLLVQCETAPASTTCGMPTAFSDAQVMHYAVNAANGAKVVRLATEGNWNLEYTSQSEADLGLCMRLAFWTRDVDQIDRLFRLSALMRPKWERDSYGRKTVREALARQGEHFTQLGALDIAPQWQDAPGAQEARAPAWPKARKFTAILTDLADMLERTYPLPRWLIKDLIPEGLVYLVGAPKSSKTYLAHSLALSLVVEAERGGLWLGQYDVTNPGPVIYISLEDDVADSHLRVKELTPTLTTIPRERFLFMHGIDVPLFDEGLLDVLRDQIIAHYHPSLIVLDPISYLYSQTRKGADQFSEIKNMLLPLRWLGKEHHCTILAIDHRRKKSADDVDIFETTYGSTAKIAVADSIIMVVREEKDITLHARVRKAEDQTITLNFAFAEDGSALWTWKGSTNGLLDASQYGELRMKVCEALSGYREPMSVTDLLAALDIPESNQTKTNIRKILWRAERGGEVQKTTRGQYVWCMSKE